MLHNVTDVTPATLLDTVAARFPQGYRLITLTCVDCGDAREILYHFDRNYELSHVRLRPRARLCTAFQTSIAAPSLSKTS